MKILANFFAIIFSISAVWGVDLATITVGTNAEFPPFSFKENGQIVGIDIDVAKEVCKRLDKKLSLKDLPFDALIPELSLGQVQFVAAGMSYTEERAKRVLFITPHLTNDPLIVLSLKKNDDAKNEITLSDLVGKKVIVNEGFTADLYVSSQPGVNLIRLTTVADAMIALKTKRADYFVTARSTFNAFSHQQSTDQFQYNILADNPENYSLIVSKKHPDLQKSIQNAIEAMIADGTIDRIKKKWHLDD